MTLYIVVGVFANHSVSNCFFHKIVDETEEFYDECLVVKYPAVAGDLFLAKYPAKDTSVKQPVCKSDSVGSVVASDLLSVSVSVVLVLNLTACRMSIFFIAWQLWCICK
eukprot:GFUD01132668.1.p2 GENE.GFUD01132668.1~~GFUD01132668.1.p2  ORF type:complete len:109 (-),score=11.40 GFUD01132668.1:32-358(-)